MLRVVLIDNHLGRTAPLSQYLADAGYEVVSQLADITCLDEAVRCLQPDFVIIDIVSPSKNMLEHLFLMNCNMPQPIVMFTYDGDTEKIWEATRAGVSAYVVGEISHDRLKPVVDAAIARFEEFKTLRKALESANNRLSERKVIEKAKGILMQQRNLCEDEAYKLLRTLAMQQKTRLAVLARQIVKAAELLL